MKCKIARSYVFSDQAFSYLQDFGFRLSIENCNEFGCRRGLLYLQDAHSQVMVLEFIEVLDEDLFLSPSSKKKFGFESFRKNEWSPFLFDDEVPEVKASDLDANRVFKLREVIESSSMDGHPWQSYLSLAKRPGLVAVVVECPSLETVKAQRDFQREFTFQSRPYGLIHMGPNSFDLLVTPASASV